MKEIKEKWRKFHNKLYLPGSAINTNTIYKWWKREFQNQTKESQQDIKAVILMLESSTDQKIITDRKEIANYIKEYLVK